MLSSACHTMNETMETTSATSLSIMEVTDPSLNLTRVKHAKASLLLYDVLTPLLGSLIVVLNLVVVVSVILILKRSRASHNSTTYLFLGNMALMDCITGLTVLFGQYYPRQYRGEITCAFQIGFIVASTLASVWSVGLIALDRFLYIVHGLKYSRWVTMTTAKGLICFTWFVGGVLGFLPAMGWTGATDGGKVCWFIRLAPPGLIVLITVVGVIPILMVVGLYSVILYHAIKKVMQLRRADAEANNKVGHSAETGPQKMRLFRGGRGGDQAERKGSTPNQWKAVKIVLLTAGSFIFTWMPYFIACCVYVACQARYGGTADNRAPPCKSLELTIAAPLAVLGFLNCLFNPLIYAWWHAGFRGLARGLWCRQTAPRPAGASSHTTKTSLTSLSSSKTQGVATDPVVSSL